MVTSLRCSQTLLAILTAVYGISSGGCAALRQLSNPAGGGERTGLTPSPVAPIVTSIVDAPDSVFRVVAWAMAIVLGALVLAFVAKLLNHRRNKES